MQFAKANTGVAYHLGASGVANYPLRLLPVTLAELEITGESTYGYPPLQEALSEFCSVPQENIVTSIGTSLANHLAIASIIEPGDDVLIESPTYELIRSTAGFLGAHLIDFPRRPENGYHIDPADIRRLITPATRLIIVTNLHNPSSVLTDEATLAEIGKIAVQHGAKVLVDEVYLDAAFTLRPRTSFMLGPEFVVTSSLTKVYGLSGLRCGWILAEKDLSTKMWHLNDLFGSIPAHPAERLSIIALKNIGTIRSRSMDLIETNRRLVQAFLSSRNDCETINPGIGTVVFPRLLKGNVEDLYNMLVQKYSTSIAPGRFFGMKEHFRIGIGLEKEEFRQGLENLGRALDKIS
jgi:aspartate/methionine/tyrosine aminotransferase